MSATKSTQKKLSLEREDARLVENTLTRRVAELQRNAKESKWQAARSRDLGEARDLERIIRIFRRA